MWDAASVAKAYLDTWNEPSLQKRREVLEKHWLEDAQYVDPMMSGVGHEQISGLVSAVHERFPRFSFRLTGVPNGYGDYVRLSWSLGADGEVPPIEGSDVVRVRQGRIHSVVGFIDRAPAA